jgi:hypothetical protein
MFRLICYIVLEPSLKKTERNIRIQKINKWDSGIASHIEVGV